MLIALLVFVVWPVAELFVIVKVAEAIGVLDTILLLIAGWPLGLWAMRSQGRVVLRRLGTAISEGRPPAREVVNGALVLLGGGLLMVPGFITDAVGLVLLVPPTRALVRLIVIRNFRSRFVVQAVGFTTRRANADVDSTATDIEPPQLRP
jgi:UPF0716 protein FxsA